MCVLISNHEIQAHPVSVELSISASTREANVNESVVFTVSLQADLLPEALSDIAFDSLVITTSNSQVYTISHGEPATDQPLKPESASTTANLAWKSMQQKSFRLLASLASPGVSGIDRVALTLVNSESNSKVHLLYDLSKAATLANVDTCSYGT